MVIAGESGQIKASTDKTGEDATLTVTAMNRQFMKSSKLLKQRALNGKRGKCD